VNFSDDLRSQWTVSAYIAKFKM